MSDEWEDGVAAEVAVLLKTRSSAVSDSLCGCLLPRLQELGRLRPTLDADVGENDEIWVFRQFSFQFCEHER